LQPDNSLLVTETITVYAAGSQIRHGIYREFPTQYQDPYNNRYVVGFEMQSASYDAAPEHFRVEDRANGKRVYLGDPNTFVPVGRHTYTLRYRTTRQLGFYKDHDALYWNVTGNGWIFVIDHASATVHLPSTIPADQVTLAGFTGPQGSRATDLDRSEDDGSFEFSARHALGSNAGLSVLLMWPKGYVTPPSTVERLQYFFQDNRDALLLGLGFLAISVYYFMAWSAVGRDPARGVIMPRYEPPPDLSPAAMRYLVRMGYDQKTFAAAVLDMAARGYLRIKEQAGSYTLYLTGKDDRALAPDEKLVASELFDGRNDLWMHQENHMIFAAAQKALKQCLKKAEERVYFVTNSRYVIAPVVFSIALCAVTVYLKGLPQLFMAGFLCFWLTFWSLGTFGLLFTVVKNWRAVLRGQKPAAGGTGTCLLLTVFAIPFLGFEIMGLGFLVKATSLSVAFFVVACAGLHILFLYLLKAPTTVGRMLLDQVEGFKMFLGAVDGDRLNRVNPPEQTPETFEKFLPYALALDVEQAWSEKFSGVLAMAGTAPGDNAAYTPSFYSGADNSFSGSAFSSSFTDSFASAISSSSSAPGSSGGGGGDGGSGGGGGGGGGGGW
jgi:uncharacterized membrane protein YgcG